MLKKLEFSTKCLKFLSKKFFYLQVFNILKNFYAIFISILCKMLIVCWKIAYAFLGKSQVDALWPPIPEKRPYSAMHKNALRAEIWRLCEYAQFALDRTHVRCNLHKNAICTTVQTALARYLTVAEFCLDLPAQSAKSQPTRISW